MQYIIKNLNIKNPFKNNKAGRKWFELFLQRHPEIARRVTEKLSKRRAELTEEGLRSWFDEINEYLFKNNLLSIGPGRIFNCDESGIQFYNLCKGLKGSI